MANVFLAPKTKEVFTCIWNGEQIKITVLIVPHLGVREWTSQESKVNRHSRWTSLWCLGFPQVHNSHLILIGRSYQFSV